jgi:hypothetical protein
LIADIHSVHQIIIVGSHRQQFKVHYIVITEFFLDRG